MSVVLCCGSIVKPRRMVHISVEGWLQEPRSRSFIEMRKKMPFVYSVTLARRDSGSILYIYFFSSSFTRFHLIISSQYD